MPAKSRPLPPLLFSDSEHHADQLYFGRFHMSDPYLAFAIGRTKFAVLNQLEFSRGREESAYDVILAAEDWEAKAKKRFRAKVVVAADIVATLGAEYRLGGFRVPADFPAAVLEQLRARKVKVVVETGQFFPERELKTAAEAAEIAEGNRLSALGFATVERMLRAAAVADGRLWLDGAELTSETVRQEIAIAILRAGGVAANTIVAGGEQACAPHGRGTGPLRPGELIIVDIFPRVARSGYHGDMTRTYLKGTASDAQRAIMAAVKEAHGAALAKVKAGVSGKAVHEAALKVFARREFETVRDGQGARGFIHGTGHGLGLAVHEAPGVSLRNPRPLKAGAVITIEPGLYYPGVGAARIEDVVQVTRDGSRPLSAHPYDWEIA